MNVKVLTAGCCNQNSLYDRVKTVSESTGIDASVERIEDMKEVMRYGVMETPALVIDGEVQVTGRLPSSDEIAAFLRSS